MAGIDDYYASTVVNIDDTNRVISTTHNELPAAVANVLFSLTSDTDPTIAGGYLKAIQEATRGQGTLSDFVASVNHLVNLLKNGITVNDATSRVSLPLARDVEAFLKSIDAVSKGAVKWDGTMSTMDFTESDMNEWFSIYVMNDNLNETVKRLVNDYVKIEPYYATGGILKYRVVPNEGTITAYQNSDKIKGSLQAMVELIYVKGANQYLSDGMDDLDEALTLSRNAMASLINLQALHNNLTTVTKGPIAYDLRSGGQGSAGSTTDNANYNQQAYGSSATGDLTGQATIQQGTFTSASDAYFGSPPTLTIGAGLENPISIFEALQTEASTVLNALNAPQLRTMATTIQAHLQAGTAIPSATVTEFFTYTSLISKYNELVAKANRQLEPINSILAANGQTTLNLTGYSGFLGSTGTGGIINLPLTLPLLPQPAFSSLDLANVQGEKTGLGAQVASFVTQMQAVFETSGISSSFTFGVFATGTNQLGFNMGDFLGTVFNMPLMIQGDPSKGIPRHPIFDFYYKMVAEQQNIANQIAALEARTPSDATNKFDYQGNTTLITQLKKVNASIQDIIGVQTTIQSILGGDFNQNPTGGVPQIFAANGSNKIWDAITAFASPWLLDNSDKLASASAGDIGRIQNDLGTAIGAAQSLNDSQKEETRRLMFIFEEFYKSAGSILEIMTKLLEKIARNVTK